MDSRIGDVKAGNKITFSFVGDVLFGGEFLDYVENHNIDLLHPFQEVKSLFSDTDIFIANLEGPIFKGKNKRKDVTALLNNHHAIIDYFKQYDACVLTLGNNHVMDYGQEGLFHTLDLLRKYGIYCIGAGINAEEAWNELIIEVRGKKVAFLSFTSDSSHIKAVIASSEKPGCASFSEQGKIIEKLKELRNRVDILCIALHWGYEYFQYPSYEQKKLAHLLVDAGATYIVGHHPHAIQGVEKYKDSLIMYSLGNFFLPPFRFVTGRLKFQKKIEKEFMVVNSVIDELRNATYDCIGGSMLKNYTLMPYAKNAQEKFNNRLNSISKPIIFNNYNNYWLKYKNEREKALVKEELLEAFKKAYKMPLRDLLKTIKLSDLKRNVSRLCRVITKEKSIM